MWPQLIMALAGTLLQKKQEKDAYGQAQLQRGFDVENAIAARRSGRAGDSGYMQSALGQPLVNKQPSQAGHALAQVGAALAMQDKEPGAMERDDNEDGYLPTRMRRDEF